MLGAEALHDERADAAKERIARGEDAHVVLVRERSHAIEDRVEPALEHDPLALELREEGEMPLAAGQHLGRRHRARGAGREAGAAVVADADQRDRDRSGGSRGGPPFADSFRGQQQQRVDDRDGDRAAALAPLRDDERDRGFGELLL